MQTNSRTDSPIRTVSARAILLVLAFPLVPSFIMKKSAETKLPKMAKNANATRYFM
ncbi:hypothetical protein HC248_02760 [Polaromonas vacuolata]|uniref:Uncharacterized protein n=1 Tax=Polaromonas vacuolata TaxID=37448 RepID=A0A6H2HC30_9BURK|nr:hypothetical protein HC248_02760 [Polaromonas vacuolata]